MAIEILKSGVQYAAGTKLIELALLTASTKSLRSVEEEISQGAKIHRWLQALDYSDYLSQTQIDLIVRCLLEIAEVNDIPAAPYLGNIEAPSILVGIRGQTGEQGEEGPEGGGVPFTYENITSDTVVDSFSITESRGVAYELNIYGDDGMRTQRIIGGWSADGSDYGDDGGDGTDDIYGDTSPVTISIVVTGSTAQLFAAVTSGEWTISGTRKYIPNNGSGIVSPTSLTSGRIWVGNASNVPTAVAVSGDFTISSAGVGAITAGTITNAHISSSAGITANKLQAMTASRAVVTTSGGILTTASVTATEVGFLAGVTSSIQSQLNTKVSSTSGAISTVVSSNLTVDRIVIANGLGKIAVSDITYLSGNDFYSASSTGLTWRGGLVNSVGAGGDMILRGGGSSADGFAAGNLYLFGGIASGAGNTGAGNIYMRLLSGTGTGADGKLNIEGLPTSSAGLSTGDVWNDGGTLKIV